ncbi:MAG: SIS domain-containing protein [Myxococcales bacterium]|nr:SIS domain-containing protein [Myxococcales bacterium]
MMERRFESPLDAPERVRASLAESARVKHAVVDACADAIARAAEVVARAFARDARVLVFGNGGSASDAQHFAAELAGRFDGERPALPALALTANSSDLTAIGNDYGFQHTFARLIQAHGRPGDVAVAISTSGDSANVNAAVSEARARGLSTIGLIGKGGGELATLVDTAVVVPSDSTPRIQESHIAIAHVICELVEASLFPADGA